MCLDILFFTINITNPILTLYYIFAGVVGLAQWVDMVEVSPGLEECHDAGLDLPQNIGLVVLMVEAQVVADAEGEIEKGGVGEVEAAESGQNWVVEPQVGACEPDQQFVEVDQPLCYFEVDVVLVYGYSFVVLFGVSYRLVGGMREVCD